MAADKNIILDVSVIIDLWVGENHAQDTERLIDEAVGAGIPLWVASSSLATLDYVGQVALKRKGYPVEKVKTLVASLIENLFSFASVLTAHGFEQAEVYAKAFDFEDAQIAASARSLPGSQSCVVTADRTFDGLGEVTVLAPDEALKWIHQGDGNQASRIPFIDLGAQQRALRPGIEKNIESVLRHGKYIMGPEVGELEERLCAFTGSRHCISCASGTDALLMALMALDIGPGNEVITVPYTWISTAEVVALLGARPVFVDIQPDTMNMDPDQVEEAITQRTRAIMPVGIYGQCADMTRINDIAHRHGIPVIEDAAQSFGATHHNRKSCALSEIGCTSFFPSKPLGGYGDGGAIFTDDQALADRMRQIRVHGQKVKHEHPLVGINGRLDTLQAAVVLEKLKVFPGECILRREAAGRYDNLLSGLSGIQTPAIASGNESVYAQYTILTRDRDSVSKRLQEAGIPSVAYYAAPLHLQGAFSSLGHTPGDFAVAEQVAAQCLSLPMNPYLKKEEQERICECLKG